MASFGKEIMRRDFLLDPKQAFINHGSFGTAPQRVFEHRLRLIDEQERQPDYWFRKTCDEAWKNNLVSVAEFLRAEPSNVVFVNNTTTGVNAVVLSLNLKEGDAVLINQFTYGAVKNICYHLAQQRGFEVITVEYDYPLKSVDQLLDAYEQALSTHPNIKLTIVGTLPMDMNDVNISESGSAILSASFLKWRGGSPSGPLAPPSFNFLSAALTKPGVNATVSKSDSTDYISSLPTALLPVKELITVCRRHQTLTFIDGAHSPGQVDLDLENLCADFFIGNLHKWAFAARGCAVLWVHPKYHKLVFPPVISGYYSTDDWQYNFMYVGTGDTSQYCCAATAVQYYKDIGDYEVISSYNTELVSQAADMLVQRWDTEHYPLPEEMKTPFMRMVRLPSLKGYTDTLTEPLRKHAASDLSELMFLLFERFGIQVVCSAVDGISWVRISAMVYNCMEDYERLADAILQLKNELE